MKSKAEKTVRMQEGFVGVVGLARVHQLLLSMVAGMAAAKKDLMEWVQEVGLHRILRRLFRPRPRPRPRPRHVDEYRPLDVDEPRKSGWTSTPRSRGNSDGDDPGLSRLRGGVRPLRSGGTRPPGP
jgi:hypothetical protein